MCMSSNVSLHPFPSVLPNHREEAPDAPPVLLIESHPPLARAIHRLLEEEGYTVVIAPNRTLAHCYTPPTGYAAIILDPRRPQTDDHALLQCWRRAGLTSPVLVLTD